MENFEFVLDTVVRFARIGISAKHCAEYILEKNDADDELLVAMRHVGTECKSAYNEDYFKYAKLVYADISNACF